MVHIIIMLNSAHLDGNLGITFRGPLPAWRAVSVGLAIPVQTQAAAEGLRAALVTFVMLNL
jgi:hypothetical protein